MDVQLQELIDKIKKDGVASAENEAAKIVAEAEKNAEQSIATENVQILVDKLKRKRNKIILRLYKNVYRLKRAFPDINTKEITEVLNKKIDIRKKRKNTWKIFCFLYIIIWK